MSEAGSSSSDAKLTVCIDFKSPQAYLAIDPTYALADELDLEIDWLPLLVAPMTRPEPVAENADRGTRHRGFRAEYAEREIRRHADLRGLVIKEIYRAPVDSSLAGVGLLWVKEHSRECLRGYMARIFDGYWRTRELDIADASAIAGIVEEIGAESEGCAAYLNGEGREALERLQTSLHEAGLFNVPGYVVDEEIFFGRQHLPMIRWLLTDKQGHPPI